MRLVAYMDGDRIDATQMPHAAWRALASHPGYTRLVLPECGVRASRVTRNGRQFFAHVPENGCALEHKSESEQHLAMKQAVAGHIDARPGWRAEVEHAGPGRDWIADVMAFGPGGRQVAFEVQLSNQSEEDYVRRSQRYLDAGIETVWLVAAASLWRSAALPVVVTGFDKTTKIPTEAAELLGVERFQPLARSVMPVGRTVDMVLSPAFTWDHGSPADQFERFQRRQAEHAATEAAAAAETERVAHLRNLETQKDNAAFTRGAKNPSEHGPLPTIQAHTQTHIWCSSVTCPEGHRVLIWHAQHDPTLTVRTGYVRHRRESHADVQVVVNEWIQRVGAGFTKALFAPVKDADRAKQAFMCPECQRLLEQRLIAALPAEKWFHLAWTPARSTQPDTAPRRAQGTVREREKASSLNDRLAWQQLLGQGPFEEVNPLEADRREAAKVQRAAEKEAVRSNPRYLDHGNDFRLTCLDCGKDFEDFREGIHARGGCLA